MKVSSFSEMERLGVIWSMGGLYPLSPPISELRNGGMSEGQGGWIPPIRRTVATDGSGLPELVQSIEEHAQHLRRSGDWSRRERARLEAEFELLLQQMLLARFHAAVAETELAVMLDAVQGRKLSPRAALEKLMEEER